MISKIEEAKKQYDEGNYESALDLLDNLSDELEHSKLALTLKFLCFMNLKRYDESLNVINSLIEIDPYNEFFWSCKVKCHYFNDGGEKALKALEELERITDNDDKEGLVTVAELFNLVRNYKKALEYCDKALALDENYIPAIREKAMAASSLGDNGMMSDCADKLLEVSEDEGVTKILIPFMLKLFSGRYRDCCNIVNSVADLDGEINEMLKGAIYKTMIDDLNIEIRISQDVEAYIDESLELLFDYHYEGIDSGLIKGVDYWVVPKK